MERNAKNIIPVRATHPGSVLRNELRARGIKQKDFAQTLGMPAPNLSEIINGKRSVTEDIAIRLEKALGIPYMTWINLQSRYNYVIKCHEEGDLNVAEAEGEYGVTASDSNLSNREAKKTLLDAVKALFVNDNRQETLVYLRTTIELLTSE